ncbi:hypothetical protein ACS0TY_007320 [Phlomoides rotata]
MIHRPVTEFESPHRHRRPQMVFQFSRASFFPNSPHRSVRLPPHHHRNRAQPPPPPSHNRAPDPTDEAIEGERFVGSNCKEAQS